jgi:hypothetical protein
MLTIKKVNKALAAWGLKMELVKGEGYFYFVGDDVDLSAGGVYSNALNHQGIAGWINDALERKK